MRGLKLMLQSLGINIDAAEVEKAFHQAKEAIPQIVQLFHQIQESQKRTEEQNKQIMELVKLLTEESQNA
jgi:hypothetical protein